MEIPVRYQPRLLTPEEKAGYLDWSLDFFTDDRLLQIPYIDLTLQLDVTNAYGVYQRHRNGMGSFFAFLLWHWMQCLQNHREFRLRHYNQQWYVLDNPPAMVSVAIGGKERFSEMLLENVVQLSYKEFSQLYSEKLAQIRAGHYQRAEYDTFCLACIFGNLPNLKFTALSVHYRRETIQGQPWFYFGQRYWQDGKLLIPLCFKIHHANTDPLVLDQAINQFQAQFI
jgi:chloramphenicol O-acetyltransferase